MTRTGSRPGPPVPTQAPTSNRRIPAASAIPTSRPRKPAELVARIGRLASFPQIFAQVTQLIDRPSSSAVDIATVISTDQALAARLLRIANSALYGFSSKVESIPHAIVVIGTGQLRDLLVGTIATSQFSGLSPHLVDMPSFWRHSIACGLTCRAIAARRSEPNREKFFLAGLLHDIGNLVIYQQIPGDAEAVLQRHHTDGLPLHEIELQALGYDHAEVGAALLSAWKLPSAIRTAAGEHHRWKAKAPHALETAVVHVADVIVHGMSLGTNGERHVPKLDPGAWDAVGLSTHVLERVCDEVERLLQEVERLFLTE